MIINREVEKSDQLQELIFQLGVPYVSERSIKVVEGTVLTNRQLYSLHKSVLGDEPKATLKDIFSHIAIPEECTELIDSHFAAADNIHFGFEESTKGITYKIYLEFADRFWRAMESGAGNDSGLLVHLACKWAPDNPDSMVVTRYRCQPSLTFLEISDKLSAIYRHCDSEIPLDISTGFLTHISSKMPVEDVFFTEVEEEGNPRCSYDVNVYDADLTVSDIKPYLSRMWQHFNIPADESRKIYAGLKNEKLGHVAGGLDRENRGFFSFYFSVEMHPAGEYGDASPVVQGQYPIELSCAEDRYVDYCLWDYQPLCSYENKYRAINLLFNSFAVAGSDNRMAELSYAIRESIGSSRTVWGVKQSEGKLSWEYYFYDYDREDRQVSIQKLQEVIRPYANSSLTGPEDTPYFMFSIDIDNELVRGQRELDDISVYIGNPGSNVSSGLCYSLNQSGMKLANLYCFFDAATELDEIVSKVVCSIYLDQSELDIKDILWPELIDCKTIVVANKQGRDGVYFSRVNVYQLLFFLKKMNYPDELISYVENNHHRYDHLLYDVGIDYVMHKGKVNIVKSAYYGFF